MPAVENRLDDVGSEKGERQDTADVALMDAVALSQLTDRCGGAVAKLLEPSGRRSNGVD